MVVTQISLRLNWTDQFGQLLLMDVINVEVVSSECFHDLNLCVNSQGWDDRGQSVRWLLGKPLRTPSGLVGLVGVMAVSWQSWDIGASLACVFANSSFLDVLWVDWGWILFLHGLEMYHQDRMPDVIVGVACDLTICTSYVFWQLLVEFKTCPMLWRWAECTI